MVDLSKSSVFESLFQSALEEHETETGINLIRHPFAFQLEHCNSVASITKALQEQAQPFQISRDGYSKVMALLEQTVQALHRISTAMVFVESPTLVCQNGS
jgi:hypothetical protein